METSTIISLTGGFFKFVGDVIADLKSQELATINVDLLNLKRTQLTEKLEEFKTELDAFVNKEKARAEQDLISRGMGNTTIRDSILRGIEQDASNELQKVLREYNRAIEEIVLLERKVNVQARPRFKKIFSAMNSLVYLLALVGAGMIISGVFPKTSYELDHGAYIALVRSSWWDLKQNRYPIRLQHHEDWKNGNPYRAPSSFDEFDWFIKGKNGEWYPMNFDPY